MYRQLEPKLELSRAQFESARLGFFQTLRRKRMSPQFVERHGEELFAQACFEYSRRASEGIDIADAPAWIVTCAWHRTVGLLETRDWRPRLVSTDSIAERADDGDSTPEEAFLSEDRARKVREAVEELPAYQRRMLALSYFEDASVREAGRRLRWTASKAQRAHEAAQKCIHEILGVESSDEIEIGLFAFLSVAREHSAGRALPTGFEAALGSAHRGAEGLGHTVQKLTHLPGMVRAGDPGRAAERLGAAVPGGSPERRSPLRRLADVGRRVVDGGGSGAAAVTTGEGAGRVLEVCKGLAVCAIGGGGALTGVLIGGGHHPERPVAAKTAPIAHVRRHEPARQATPPVTGTVAPSAPDPRPPHEVQTQAPHQAKESTHAVESKTRVEEPPPTAQTEAAQGESEEREAVEQFGDIASTEGGSAESGSESTSGRTFDEKTSGQPPASAEGAADPKEHAEEAGAAKEFHGLLE